MDTGTRSPTNPRTPSLRRTRDRRDLGSFSARSLRQKELVLLPFFCFAGGVESPRGDSVSGSGQKPGCRQLTFCPVPEAEKDLGMGLDISFGVIVGVYLGADSCYARKEGIYVKRVAHPGIDTVREALGILYLILRDKRRGWTYDSGSCRKIRMSHDLFVRRVNYVSTLAKKHGASKHELQIIDYLVDYVRKNGRLPPGYTAKARAALARPVRPRNSLKRKRRKK